MKFSKFKKFQKWKFTKTSNKNILEFYNNIYIRILKKSKNQVYCYGKIDFSYL